MDKNKTVFFIIVIVIGISIPFLLHATSTEILLLKKRAKKGYSVDEYLYGRHLLLGNYPLEKKMEGIRYLRKSASSGYEPAILFLARMYEEGIGEIEPNYIEAYKWYKKAKDMGSEIAKIKLGPLEDSKNATKKGFRLFGIILKESNRFTIRYVLQKNGAVPLKIDNTSFCDIFDSSKLVNGTDKVQVCFSPENKFALLEYRYPPRQLFDYEKTLAFMLEKLKKKYGTPKEIRTNNLTDIYLWQEDDITIYFWMEPKTNTCFLRYIEPDRYNTLYNLYKLKETKEKLPKIEFF